MYLEVSFFITFGYFVTDYFNGDLFLFIKNIELLTTEVRNAFGDEGVTENYALVNESTQEPETPL